MGEGYEQVLDAYAQHSMNQLPNQGFAAPRQATKASNTMATSIAGVPIMGVDDLPEDYGRFLLHGPQGAGKTTLASTIAKMGKTLFVDLNGEKGVRSFRGATYAKNIDVIRPESVTKLDDIFWFLDKGEHPYQAVVLDSLTALQKMVMRYLLGHDETAVREIQQGTAPADIRTWGQALDIMVDTATFWYGLADGDRPHPMHVIMTAQTKVTENEEMGTISRSPDVQKGAMSITLAAPDYVMYCDVEQDFDRTGDDGSPAYNHIVRMGADPAYRTKARIPANLRGKLPSVLGRGKNPPDLTSLAKVLRLGGTTTKTDTSK